MLPLKQLSTTNLTVAGKPATAVTTKEYDELKGNAKREARAAVSAAAEAWVYGRDIMNLLSVGSFGTEQSYSRHIKNYLGESYFLPVRDPKAAAVLSEIQRKALAIQEFGREADGTRNSINTAAEIARQAQRWGTSLTLGEALVNFFYNDPALRKARFEPTLEILKNNLGRAQSNNGLYIRWK